MLTVHLRINDAATGKPTPVRLCVSGPNGAYYAPLGRSVEFPIRRNEAVGGQFVAGSDRWFYIDGACEVVLPSGIPLRVQAKKGLEYTPLDETVTLGAGQMALRFAIERWTDTRADGWVRIDTRCHFLTPHDALLEAAAEDLDIVNILAMPFSMLALDGNTYTTTPNLLAFSGQKPALEADGRSVVVNTFNAHPVLGKVALLHAHRPIFPLTFGGEEPDDWSVCDWCDQCHRKGGLTVWVDAFDPAGGITGGEALVAAVLGKIDAIEYGASPRKLPLLPWLYQLWDAGFLVPLVGASGKDSNGRRLGAVRTYARAHQPGHPPATGAELLQEWVAAVKAGRSFVTSAPLLDYHLDGSRLRLSGRSPGSHGKLEVVANGEVVAACVGSPRPESTVLAGELEVEVPAGWAAVRWGGQAGFAHTSPIVVGTPARKPEAVAELRKLIEQSREWIDTTGRFTNPRRKSGLLARCDEALAVLTVSE